jgi:hypothetical protein
MEKLVRLIILAALLSVGADAAAPQVELDPSNTLITRSLTMLAVQPVGRVEVTPLLGKLPKGARSFTHQWPGVYFEAQFDGEEIFLKFDDAINEYRLLVGSQAPITISKPGRVEVRVSNLPSGNHLLRLEKVTESSSGRGSFQGFYAPGSQVIKIRARRPQIEFIGDSAMTGFGARSGTRECSSEQVQLTTDTQRAFPALIAKKHGADYQINAVSGAGVVRNYGGGNPDRTLPRVYPFTFFDRSVPYLDPEWSPRLIMIKLEADFAAPLKPNEQWASDAELARDYASRYGSFIAELHGRHPNAAFLLWWFDRDSVRDINTALLLDHMQQQIGATARAAGVRDLHVVPMRLKGLKRTACASHYSLSDHNKLADYFSDFIARARLLPKI